MSRPARLLGGLMLGGASRRFGRPKQLAEIAGEALAARVHRALEGHVDEVILLGAGAVPERLRSLPQWPDDPGPGFPRDFGGPLAAMVTAFRRRPDHGWIFAPCDLPAVRSEAIAWLISERRPERAAVLARTPNPRRPTGRVEPLLALYEPAAAALLSGLATAGEGAPKAVADLPGVAVLEPPQELVECWRDVDTEGDLERYRDPPKDG